MVLNYYSQYDFDELTAEEKWNAYVRLRHHADFLQSQLDNKSGVIGQKRKKIDYLRNAKEESLRQQAARNYAGSNARSAAYQTRKENLLAIYLELRDERNRQLAEAETLDYERPKRLSAKEVAAEYSMRFPRREHMLKLSTVRNYINKFKQGFNAAPEVFLAINN